MVSKAASDIPALDQRISQLAVVSPRHGCFTGLAHAWFYGGLLFDRLCLPR